MKTIISACAALLLGIAVHTQAQPGGGPGAGGGRRGGGGMGGGMGIETEWALVCFEFKVDGEQFSKLRTIYQEAWEQRKLLMKEVQEGKIEREAMFEEMQGIQGDLAGKYRKILTKEQVEKLNSLVEARRAGWGGRGQGR